MVHKVWNILLIAGVLAAGAGCSEPLEKPVAAVSVPTQAAQPAATVAAPTPESTPEATPIRTPTPTPTATPVPIATEAPTPEVTAEPLVLPDDHQDDAAGGTIQPVSLVLPEDVTSPYAKSYPSPYNASGVLSNKKLSWYFNRNKTHQPPTAQKDFDIRQFDAYYLGDITQKTVYLTFDEGYENGYTAQILDILNEKQVPAAFFVTKPYIKSVPELVKRMADEGFAVGNHTVTHSSMPDQSDDDIQNEITETALYYKEVTGADMPGFFRPPMGEYSARTLALTQKQGYKTIFWSFAYQDWLVDQQPGKQAAYENVINGIHNGAILLLHAVSKSNTEALPDIIDTLRAEGYEFKSLYDLPETQSFQ